MTVSEYPVRFGGIRRLYGEVGAHTIKHMHVCVVGIGGVGSWAVEALARTGVGTITLIDHDDIAISNINRQLHALSDTTNRSKVEVMAERVAQINPECDCRPIDDFVSLTNIESYIRSDFDYVIDAIDAIKFKAAMLAHCRRNKIPVITTGGAGGLTDPTAIEVTDLSRTYNDPLAAKVRATLRSKYGFSKNSKRRFGIECVFSAEQPVYPRPDGGVGHEKPGVHGATLDCNFGYGSATHVTASFGFVAAARAIRKAIERAERQRLQDADR